MKFTIEGEGFTYDLEGEREGVKVSALLQVQHGDWRYIPESGSPNLWLATTRANWYVVLVRALKQLDADWQAKSGVQRHEISIQKRSGADNNA